MTVRRETKNPARLAPGGVSTIMGGVVLGVAGRTRGSSNSPPKLSLVAVKLSMLPTLANVFGFAFYFGCDPFASDRWSMARFSATEVREQSRFAETDGKSVTNTKGGSASA